MRHFDHASTATHEAELGLGPLVGNVLLVAGNAVESGPQRRSYDSPVRRDRVKQTRERIILAGVNLAHSMPRWDWRELTFRKVADEAGVGLRTVYRYFPTERDLHGAVMRRLEDHAGVGYDGMGLGDVAAVAAKVFDSLKSYSVQEWVPEVDHPTHDAADQRRRDALLRAVSEAAPGWSDDSIVAVASALDVLWSVEAYSRLVRQWDIDGRRAAQVLCWLIELAVGAVDEDAEPRFSRSDN